MDLSLIVNPLPNPLRPFEEHHKDIARNILMGIDPTDSSGSKYSSFSYYHHVITDLEKAQWREALRALDTDPETMPKQLRVPAGSTLGKRKSETDLTQPPFPPINDFVHSAPGLLADLQAKIKQSRIDFLEPSQSTPRNRGSTKSLQIEEINQNAASNTDVSQHHHKGWTNPAPNTQGPSVRYDSDIQKSLEDIVKFLSLYKSMIRKEKIAFLAAKIKSRVKDSDSEENCELQEEERASGGIPTVDRQHLTADPTEESSSFELDFWSDDIYDQLQRELTECQGKCERAADQILRNIDCSETLKSIERHTVGIAKREEVRREYQKYALLYPLSVAIINIHRVLSSEINKVDGILGASDTQPIRGLLGQGFDLPPVKKRQQTSRIG